MIFIKSLEQIIINVIIVIISGYQKTLSPDHGWFRSCFPYGCCRFRPTCSEYAKMALKRHGLIKGTIITVNRLLRCHPGTTGGWDPVR